MALVTPIRSDFETSEAWAPPVDDAALGEFLARTASVMARAKHGYLKALARYDRLGEAVADGFGSTAHWLSWRCGVSGPATREQVRVARSLDDFPSIDRAFAEGRLSYSKVRAITRVATAENEATLLHIAESAAASQLDRIVRRFQETHGEDRPSPDEGPALRHRRLGPDRTRITIDLEHGDAARLLAAVDGWRARHPACDTDAQAEQPNASAEAPRPPSYDLEPARPKLRPRANALVDMLEALLRGELDRAETELVVHASAEALGIVKTPERTTREAPPALEQDAAVEVAGGMALSKRAFEKLICDARIRESVLDGSGSPLGLGRARRTVPGWMMRLLRQRDVGCQFPGCSRHLHLHAHHIQHWSRGGPTDPENLVLLCSAHHTQVHDEDWTIERCGDGAGSIFRRGLDGHVLEPTGPLPPPAWAQLQAWLEQRLEREGADALSPLAPDPEPDLDCILTALGMDSLSKEKQAAPRARKTEPGVAFEPPANSSIISW